MKKISSPYVASKNEVRHDETGAVGSASDQDEAIRLAGELNLLHWQMREAEQRTQKAEDDAAWWKKKHGEDCGALIGKLREYGAWPPFTGDVEATAAEILDALGLSANKYDPAYKKRLEQVSSVLMRTRGDQPQGVSGIAQEALIRTRNLLYTKDPYREGEARQHLADICINDTNDALLHVRWMLMRINDHINAGMYDKAHRWIGFIHGVLWGLSCVTLDELRGTVPK